MTDGGRTDSRDGSGSVTATDGGRPRPTGHRRGPAWARRAWLVGVVSLRRQYRKVRSHRWLAFLQAFSVLFGVVVAVGHLPVPGYASVWPEPGAYEVGRRLAAGDPGGVTLLRGFAGVLAVLTVLFTLLKETTEGAMDAHVDAMLLAAGSRSVAVGGLVWNVLLMGWQFGTIVLAGAVAFGVGSGSPAAAVLFALAGVAMLLTAVPAGFAASLAVRAAFRRVRFLREHRALVGAPLAVGYFLLFARIRESVTALGATPAGWYADVGLVAAPGGVGDPARAAAVLVAAPVVAVGLGALSVPLAERVWYADAPRPEGEDGSATVLSGTGGVLPRVAAVPTRAVARTVWLRVRREPRALLFTVFPLAIAASAGSEVVARQPAALPVVVAVYGAAAVGMGPTLNPLGAAGVGLAGALTAPGGGTALVRGYALAAVLPGAPLIAAGALLSALAIGLPAGVAVAVALLGATLALAAALVSLGVGVVLPNLEGLRPSGSGIRPPEIWASTAFLSVMLVVGLPATVGVGWAGPLGDLAGAAPGTVAVGGIGLTLGLAALAAGLGYRHAAGTVADYTMD